MNMETTYGTYDVDSFSDLYKEANGRRPGQYFWEWVNKASPEELQLEWNFLCKEADLRLLEQEAAYSACLLEFEQQMTAWKKDYGVATDTAVRWLHDAYGTQGDNEYLDYHLGVPYGTINKYLASVL
jgi:hypothetical protein